MSARKTDMINDTSATKSGSLESLLQQTMDNSFFFPKVDHNNVAQARPQQP